MTLTIGPDVRERYLKSVLNNLAEYGFTYRSILDGETAIHGVTVSQAADRAIDLDACHIRLINVDDRDRKAGLFVINEPDLAPVDMIADIGVANEDDMPLVERCIEGATSA